MKINRLAVFCGSSYGSNPVYAAAAKEFAEVLCENNIGLVYGGANVGLMKELADAMLAHQGDVIGVIPQFLVDKEIAHEDIAELHVVNTMHERKSLMAQLADGFVLLPGSIGSLDEFFEMMTWVQLGLQKKPCAILNVHHYYDKLLSFLDDAVVEQFLRSVHRQMLIIEGTPAKLIEKMREYEAPAMEKWIRELVPES